MKTRQQKSINPLSTCFTSQKAQTTAGLDLTSYCLGSQSGNFSSIMIKANSIFYKEIEDKLADVDLLPNFPGLFDNAAKEGFYHQNLLNSPSESTVCDERKDSFEKESELSLNETIHENSQLLPISNQSKHIKKEIFEKGQTKATKNGLWSEKEDALLIELYEEYGTKWTQIANIMNTGKSGKQARDRYLNALKPGIKNEEWTQEEDDQFISLYKEFRNRWCEIAAKLPGRTENQVKNRFYWHKKKNICQPAKSEKGGQYQKNKVKTELKIQDRGPKRETVHIQGSSLAITEEIIFDSQLNLNQEISDYDLTAHREVLEVQCQQQSTFSNFWPIEPSQQFEKQDLTQDVDIYFAF